MKKKTYTIFKKKIPFKTSIVCKELDEVTKVDIEDNEEATNTEGETFITCQLYSAKILDIFCNSYDNRKAKVLCRSAKIKMYKYLFQTFLLLRSDIS